METKKIISGLSGLVSDSNRYITEKGEISMLDPCFATNDCYEIYSIRGNLFEDIERYRTFKQAMKRINELLN